MYFVLIMYNCNYNRDRYFIDYLIRNSYNYGFFINISDFIKRKVSSYYDNHHDK